MSEENLDKKLITCEICKARIKIQHKPQHYEVRHKINIDKDYNTSLVPIAQEG